jgi:4-amino-4-deoxy-L-arabinose transferase-like glycosyltransferase
VRGLVTWQAWRENVAVSQPRLDGEYYLAWARDIAAGDVLGRTGTIHGEPFLLNPLYAYVVAPLVAVFGATPLPVLVFQTLLAGGTAALAAAAARRWSGPTAAWVAGLAVAFSTALTHLDGYVAVSGLAAFLVAATCFACAPAEREGEPGHGPLACGLLLGLSALARPVVLLALPFVAWLAARRARRPAAAAGIVLAAFGACAALSFARNASVSGERVVFTAANGQNLHLGNNPDARRLRAMYTSEFRFAPREMHEDAKFRVAAELGREPSRSEISGWYAARAWAELRENTRDSVLWYAQKARWFLSPEEPASSADIDFDRTLVPLLALAFAPTWLIAAFAVAGAVLCRARTDLLLGPGAIVLAHAAACALAFPLSHYRSPAIPAMAVLAGCGVANVVAGLRAGSLAETRVALIAALAAGAAGWIGPRPAYREDQRHVNIAFEALQAGDADAAERESRAALAIEPSSLGAAEVLMDVGKARRRFGDVRAWAQKLADAQPWNPLRRVELARADMGEGRTSEALGEVNRLVFAYPWSATLRENRGEFRCDVGDVSGAREDFEFAMERGVEPPAWALAKCGLR